MSGAFETSAPTPRDTRPSKRPHLLIYQTVLLTEDQAFQSMSFGGGGQSPSNYHTMGPLELRPVATHFHACSFY